MNYDFQTELQNYRGQTITLIDKHADGTQTEVVAKLGPMLESCCLNADPNKHANDKYNLYRIAKTIDAGGELTAEDVSLLKQLIEEQHNVVMTGVLFDALESPCNVANDMK